MSDSIKRLLCKVSLIELLDELDALEKKATPVGWYVEGDEVRYDCSPYATESGVSDCTINVCEVSRLSKELDHKRHDRNLIPALRNNWPRISKALRDAHTEMEHGLQCPLEHKAYHVSDCGRCSWLEEHGGGE